MRVAGATVPATFRSLLLMDQSLAAAAAQVWAAYRDAWLAAPPGSIALPTVVGYKLCPDGVVRMVAAVQVPNERSDWETVQSVLGTLGSTTALCGLTVMVTSLEQASGQQAALFALDDGSNRMALIRRRYEPEDAPVPVDAGALFLPAWPSIDGADAPALAWAARQPDPDARVVEALVALEGAGFSVWPPQAPPIRRMLVPLSVQPWGEEWGPHLN